MRNECAFGSAAEVAFVPAPSSSPVSGRVSGAQLRVPRTPAARPKDALGPRRSRTFPAITPPRGLHARLPPSRPALASPPPRRDGSHSGVWRPHSAFGVLRAGPRPSRRGGRGAVAGRRMKSRSRPPNRAATACRMSPVLCMRARGRQRRLAPLQPRTPVRVVRGAGRCRGADGGLGLPSRPRSWAGGRGRKGALACTRAHLLEGQAVVVTAADRLLIGGPGQSAADRLRIGKPMLTSENRSIQSAAPLYPLDCWSAPCRAHSRGASSPLDRSGL